MTSKTGMGRAQLSIHAFADSRRFGRELAGRLAVSFAQVRVHRFPDNESLIRVEARLSYDAVLVRSLFNPNEKILETMLAADALRRAGARRITHVAPICPTCARITSSLRVSQSHSAWWGNALGEAWTACLPSDPIFIGCGFSARSFHAVHLLYLRPRLSQNIFMEPRVPSWSSDRMRVTSAGRCRCPRYRCGGRHCQ